MDEVTKAVTKAIREHMETNELKHWKVAVDADINPGYFSQLLNGKHKLTMDKYIAICKALNQNPAKFLEEIAS